MRELQKHIETNCVQAGYTPGSGQPRQIPIIQSTTFKYDTCEAMGQLFDLEAEGYFYSRLQNPTCDMVAAKICALEGGTAAMLTSSGQAANFFALFNLASNGDHIVASSSIYGGTFNLISVTMAKMGVEATFVAPDCSEQELEAAFRPNTKAVFGETIANPALTVLDIERFADAAHRHGVPLVVDNTFATPINCRPIAWGADIVTHSTTKYMDGHAAALLCGPHPGPGGTDPHRRAGVLSLPAGTAGDGGPGDHRPPPGGGTAAPVLIASPSPSSYQKPRAHVCVRGFSLFRCLQLRCARSLTAANSA